MAPYPIYTKVLCILWREASESKRHIIRQLQTFSQLFREIVAFLIRHYFSKDTEGLTLPHLHDFFQRTRSHLQEIGKIAMDGLTQNELSFPERHFHHCMDAVTTGCKLGVLCREYRVAPKQQRDKAVGPKLLTTVLFPHKLFQEYLAGIYLASLFNSFRSEYDEIITKTVLPRAEDFKYVLFFTVSQQKDLGLDILRRIIGYQPQIDDNLIVDIAFECQIQEAATFVDRYFQETGALQTLVIDSDRPSTHTVFGYFSSLKHLVRYSRFPFWVILSVQYNFQFQVLHQV